MTGNAHATGERTPTADRGHRKRGVVPLADADLIAQYRRTLRLELADTLAELRPAPEPGLFAPNDKRPTLATRRQLVDMARALVAALSSPLELEGEPDQAGPVPARTRRGSSRVDFG
jgi:hypothetical protein